MEIISGSYCLTRGELSSEWQVDYQVLPGRRSRGLLGGGATRRWLLERSRFKKTYLIIVTMIHFLRREAPYLSIPAKSVYGRYQTAD